MCTGVDAEECARMANVLSVQNSVQAEEIASLRGLLETCTSHRNQRVYHEKILEPMDIVDHSPHGTLHSLPTRTPSHVANFSLFMSVLFYFQHGGQLPLLSLKTDSGCGPIRQPLSDFYLFCAAHLKFSINGRTVSPLMRQNYKSWTRKEGTPSQIRWYIANLSSGTKSISHPPQPPCTQVERSFTFWTALTLRHTTKFTNALTIYH